MILAEHDFSHIDSAAFHRDGYCITPPFLGTAEIRRLQLAADELFSTTQKLRAGLRDPLVRHTAFRDAACSVAVRGLVEPLLGSGAFVVRSILFDKTAETNWDVAWHQDVTIAVAERIDTPGYGPWSMKAGIPHVQPPNEVLAAMVAVRIHLDPCGAENGPLLVVPGSHRLGTVDVRSLDVQACDRDAVACSAEDGAAVIMRPLTLHASRKALSPGHRRVLHLEFAAADLPPPLKWATSSR